MTKSDHEAAKGGKSSEERRMFFVTSEEPAVISKPGNGALDDPAMAIAAEGSSVLGLRAIGSIGCDHFDAQFGEGLIEGITVVSLVADQALRTGFIFQEAEGLLDHCRLADIRRIDGDGHRNSLLINNKLQFRSLSFTGQADTLTASLGCGKRRVDKALVEAHSPLINQIADDGREDFAENVGLAPGLQIIMNRAFRRKGSRQVLPLNARVQNEQNRLEYLPLARPRTPVLTLPRPFQYRPQNLPLIITYKHSLS